MIHRCLEWYLRTRIFLRLKKKDVWLEQPPKESEDLRLGRKVGLVKNLWIATGLFLLANPIPALMISVVLFMTFISFSLIDETK